MLPTIRTRPQRTPSSSSNNSISVVSLLVLGVLLLLLNQSSIVRNESHIPEHLRSIKRIEDDVTAQQVVVVLQNQSRYQKNNNTRMSSFVVVDADDAVATQSNNNTHNTYNNNQKYYLIPNISRTEHLETNRCLFNANNYDIKAFDQERRLDLIVPMFTGMIQTSKSQLDATRRNDDDDDPDRPYWTAYFSLLQITWSKAPRHRVKLVEWAEPNKVWNCDNETAYVVAGGCPNGGGITVVCPQLETERINTITVFNETWTYTYPVRRHVDCELDHPLLPQPVNNTANISAWAMIHGDFYTPIKVVEWVEYHRLIGVDHFFLYMIDPDWDIKFDDDDNNNNNWPQLSYITYIPWNVIEKTKENGVHKITQYQIAAQQNAIFRSRAFNIQWAILCDLDEYVFVTSNQLLSEFLTTQVIHNATIGGVEGQTFTYGNHHQGGAALTTTEPSYNMDFVWRSKDGFHMKRQKTITNNQYVDYHKMHELSLGGPRHFVDPYTELRFNHFKNPMAGVFGKKDIVFDTIFRDKFKHLVVEQMRKILD